MSFIEGSQSTNLPFEGKSGESKGAQFRQNSTTESPLVRELFRTIAEEAKKQVLFIRLSDDDSLNSAERSKSPPASPRIERTPSPSSRKSFENGKPRKIEAGGKKEVSQESTANQDQVIEEFKRRFLKGSASEFEEKKQKSLNSAPSSPRCSSSFSDEEVEEEEIGKVFTAEFKIDEETSSIASERAERAETVSMLVGGLKTRINKLTCKLEQMKQQLVIEQNRMSLQKKITSLEELLKSIGENFSKYMKYIDEDTTHATTNMARQAFEELGSEVAKEELVPLLPNLRIQTVRDGLGMLVSSLTRSGAISDFSHGEISLQELKDFVDLQELFTAKSLPLSLRQKGTLTAQRQAELTIMYALTLSPEEIECVMLEIKLKALSAYGIEPLVDGLISEEVSYRLEKLIKKSSHSSWKMRDEVLLEKNRKVLESVEFSPAKLEAIIVARRERLRLLVLQDLELHLRTVPASQELLTYSRVSLVDLKKNVTREASGCVIDERTQGLDMKALFTELDGTQILFDGEECEGAYFDNENNIHMPKIYAKEGITQAILQTAFFNICVQGTADHVINKDLQKIINDETLEKLKAHYGTTEEYKALKDALNKLSENSKCDPNDVVLVATQFIQKLGGYVGLNCFGGKDRTGYAVALITFMQISRLAKQPSSELLSKWGRALLSEEGIAIKIAKDNAGQRALKLTRSNLFLFRQAGGALGAKNTAKAVVGEVAKRVRKKSFTTSRTPGQVNYSPRSESPKQRERRDSNSVDKTASECSGAPVE